MTAVSNGRLATELERHGIDLDGPPVIPRARVEDPDAIRDVHTAYFEAGADVATSATNQPTFAGFAARAWAARLSTR